MKRYDELTHRSKHELREIDESPWGWIEGPGRDEPWHRYESWISFALVIVSAAIVVLIGWALWLVFFR